MQKKAPRKQTEKKRRELVASLWHVSWSWKNNQASKQNITYAAEPANRKLVATYKATKGGKIKETLHFAPI